jgi:integrase
MAWLHGKHYWAHVVLRDGARRRISFGTSDRTVARDIEHMIKILHGRREWDLLEGALNRPGGIGELYDNWRMGPAGLADYRRRLHDVELNLYVDGWLQWAGRTAQPDTVARYLSQLRVLIPKGALFTRAQFTRKVISDALRRIPGSTTTARRHHAAWSSFGNYLVEIEVLEANPLRSIRAPRPNPPKDVYLDLSDVLRLVEAHPEPYRTIAAIREGAGVEISAALKITRRDVDLDAGVVYVRGTKTSWRNRPVQLDEWAIPHLRRYLNDHPLMPSALLFPNVKSRAVWEMQRKTVAELRLDTRYTLHDARHSFAVRWMKRGVDPQLIANNLGHKDATLVLRIYGKYRPTLQDLERARVRENR